MVEELILRLAFGLILEHTNKSPNKKQYNRKVQEEWDGLSANALEIQSGSKIRSAQITILALSHPDKKVYSPGIFIDGSFQHRFQAMISFTTFSRDVGQSDTVFQDAYKVIRSWSISHQVHDCEPEVGHGQDYSAMVVADSSVSP